MWLLPRDGNREAIQLVPAKSIASTVDTSWLSSATDVVTLNENTVFIRMYAVWWDVVVSYDNTTATVFEHIIPNGSVLDIAVTNWFNNSWYTKINALAFSGAVTSFVVIEY